MITAEEKQRIAVEIEQAVLDATRIIERLEAEGRIVGNGFHIRQDIARYAKEKFLERCRES